MSILVWQMLFPSKERERSLKNEIVLHPPNSDARCGAPLDPLTPLMSLLTPLGHPWRPLDPIVHPHAPLHPFGSPRLPSTPGKPLTPFLTPWDTWMPPLTPLDPVGHLWRSLNPLVRPRRHWARDKWSDHDVKNCSEIRPVTRIRKIVGQ